MKKKNDNYYSYLYIITFMHLANHIMFGQIAQISQFYQKYPNVD